MDSWQWMGAMRMRFQTANKSITIIQKKQRIHVLDGLRVTQLSANLYFCEFLGALTGHNLFRFYRSDVMNAFLKFIILSHFDLETHNE